MRIGRKKFLTDSAILYGIHAANYVPPLILLPYLARTLGPFHLGLLASAQAMSAIVGTLIEYGFTMTAARDVVRFREDRAQLTTLAASVTGAKLLLSLLALLGIGIAAFAVPVFRQYPSYLIGALLFGVAQGLRFDWMFMGMDKMSRAGLPDLITRPLGVLAVVLVVSLPSRAWLVLIIQAVFAASAMVWNLIWVANYIDFEWPTMTGSLGALKAGWSLFISRGSVSLYMSSNTLILAGFVSQVLVAYYAAADKLIKPFTTSLQPLGQIIYPKVNHALLHDPQHAARILRLGMFAFMGLSVSMSVFVIALCPLLVRIVLGSQYLDAVPIARLLSALIILTGMNQFLSFQWILPFHLDRFLSRATLVAGLVNVLLCAVLSKFAGGMGCAAAVVATELVVTLYLYLVLRQHDLDPFANRPLAFPTADGANQSNSIGTSESETLAPRKT